MQALFTMNIGKIRYRVIHKSGRMRIQNRFGCNDLVERVPTPERSFSKLPLARAPHTT